MNSNQLEIHIKENPIDSWLDMIVGKLVNEGIGKSNYTTNGAIYAMRGCCGFHLLADVLIDHEEKLIGLMPRYHRSNY